MTTDREQARRERAVRWIKARMGDHGEEFRADSVAFIQYWPELGCLAASLPYFCAGDRGRDAELAAKDEQIERLRFGCALAEAQRDDALRDAATGRIIAQKACAFSAKVTAITPRLNGVHSYNWRREQDELDAALEADHE